MTKQEIAKHVFARNPKLSELHITSDGQAFHEKHQAQGHAGRLKDQKVTLVQRETLKKVAATPSKKASGNATKAKDKKVVNITKTPEPVKDPKDVNPFPFLKETVDPATEAIKKVESVEELDAIEAAEKEGEGRIGVANAIEERRKELTELSNPQKPE